MVGPEQKWTPAGFITFSNPIIDLNILAQSVGFGCTLRKEICKGHKGKRNSCFLTFTLFKDLRRKHFLCLVSATLCFTHLVAHLHTDGKGGVINPDYFCCCLLSHMGFNCTQSPLHLTLFSFSFGILRLKIVRNKI